MDRSIDGDIDRKIDRCRRSITIHSWIDNFQVSEFCVPPGFLIRDVRFVREKGHFWRPPQNKLTFSGFEHVRDSFASFFQGSSVRNAHFFLNYCKIQYAREALQQSAFLNRTVAQKTASGCTWKNVNFTIVPCSQSHIVLYNTSFRAHSFPRPGGKNAKKTKGKNAKTQCVLHIPGKIIFKFGPKCVPLSFL